MHPLIKSYTHMNFTDQWIARYKRQIRLTKHYTTVSNIARVRSSCLYLYFQITAIKLFLPMWYMKWYFVQYIPIIMYRMGVVQIPLIENLTRIKSHLNDMMDASCSVLVILQDDFLPGLRRSRIVFVSRI